MQHGALLVVDAVTSLGGHELRVDDWGIDAIYSGTQKCLSCPPGLSPVSFGERALARDGCAQDEGAVVVSRCLACCANITPAAAAADACITTPRRST